MVLMMARPVRHPKTGIFLFRRRVPDALRQAVGKTEEKITLGTRDPAEAKILHARIAAEVEARWQQMAQGVQSLTHRQAEAVAGEIYRDMMREHEDDPDRVGFGALQIDRLRLGKPGIKEVIYLDDPAKSKALFERMRLSPVAMKAAHEIRSRPRRQVSRFESLQAIRYIEASRGWDRLRELGDRLLDRCRQTYDAVLDFRRKPRRAWEEAAAVSRRWQFPSPPELDGYEDEPAYVYRPRL